MHPSLFKSFPKNKAGLVGLAFFNLLIFSPFLSARQEDPQKTSQTEQKKQVKITEEIQVVGKAPRDLPVATVSTISETDLVQRRPLDLAEALKFAPGLLVTSGDKNEYNIKLRGMDSKRVALLVDGVPVIEPYYSSFDLKTISALGLDSIQITKGPSSVLYGPNTLGGIINVITRRPGPDPVLSLTGSYGGRNTRSLGADSAFQWGRLAWAGSLYYQDSDGFDVPDASGSRTERSNSAYQRLNFKGKIYYTPSDRTEIMVDGGVYSSDYGMPPALFTQKARYWKFKNWDRYTFNAGGYTALGERSILRFRTFYIGYQNTLDQWKDAAMTIRQFESTFDNAVYGLFGMADLWAGEGNALKLSLYYQHDRAKTQGDAGQDWISYNQGTFSFGLEDHFSLSDRWKVIAGVSLDVIDKFTGESKSKINPLLGLKFTPMDDLDIHLSASLKSRFPSMRSMYSPSSGNPDLLSEQGTSFELGGTWTRGVFLSGAIFTTRFKDMVDTISLPDGTKRYFNVAKAYVNGFELQAQKAIGPVGLLLNYTYLDHRNESNDRPLDALSAHNLSFDVTLKPFRTFRLSLLGLYGSKSDWFDFSSNKSLSIPSYFSLDATASFDFSWTEIFIKLTNIFDDYLYTEPGFPFRSRFVEIGVRVKVF